MIKADDARIFAAYQTIHTNKVLVELNSLIYHAVSRGEFAIILTEDTIQSYDRKYFEYAVDELEKRGFYIIGGYPTYITW